MEMLMILLFLPLVIPIIAKMAFKHKITLQEMFIQMGAVCLPVALLVGLGYVGKQWDTEIWNGKVTNKTRDHGHYERPYDCFCYRDSKGNEHCQTCYEDRYTVTWSGYTTVGNFTFQHYDRGSSSVYNEPDPKAYVDCKIGEPASIEHLFRNLVKAAPDSLFNKAVDQTQYRVPGYPRVRSFYKINRILNVDSKIPLAQQKSLNEALNVLLIGLGASKEVNVIVILTEIDDSMYRFAVENAWLGGKKNDVVVFLGLDDDTYTWVDVMTFGLNIGNETFHVQLRDQLLSHKTFDVEKIVGSVSSNVVQYYKRPKMASFEYLKDAIELPSWAIITSVVITVLGSIFLTWYFYVNDIGGYNGHYRFRRRR